MFSGIVLGSFKVFKVDKTDFGLTLMLELGQKQIEGLKQGASVSVNGVCLTVVDIKAAATGTGFIIGFDVVKETIERTNLESLKPGSLVNIERSLKFGDEVGGHLCSGHVDGLVTVSKIEKIGSAAEIEFSNSESLDPYIFEKGFVALNGASITVSKKLMNGFKVALIPETLRNTNLGNLEVGDKVNLEIDRVTQAVVDTTRKISES